jgi:predicted NBD/HSP70 family sugar kinase
MVKNIRTAIGLDITRNRIAVVAVDLTGKVISEKQENRKFERTEAYFKRLGQLIGDVVTNAAPEENRILGAGIGLPCVVTPDNQTVTFGELLQCTGATCGEFSKYIPYRTALYNDANAAGFAEFWIRRKPESAFYLMLSTNIGGSIVINNQIHHGIHFRSGEIGHLTLHPDGKPCYCGQKGCVDAYLATTVLASLASDRLPDFFKLLESKNKTALNAWDMYLDNLALTVNNLQAVFDCKVILGGYLGKFLDKYIDDLKERAAKLNFIEKSGDYLETCLYKTNSIAAGAALNLISQFIDTI